MSTVIAAALAAALAVPAPKAPPPSAATPSPAQARPGRPMMIVGSALIITSIAGYVAMAVGLGMGNNADSQVRSLQSVDDLERRREVMDRGRLGNRLALGAGLASAVLMGAGITLVVVGRRKSSQRQLVAMSLPQGAGLTLRARF